MSKYTGKQLLKVLPPPLKEAYVNELRNQNLYAGFHLRKFSDLSRMIDYIIWADSEKGSQWWMKVEGRVSRIWDANILKGNIK